MSKSKGSKGKEPQHAMEPEHALIKACREHMDSTKQHGDVCGMAVDVFDFTNSNDSNRFKKGYVYRASSKERISFKLGEGTKPGNIILSEPNKPIDARFRIDDAAEHEKLESMFLHGFSLKHEALLKPLVCASAPSDIISGINMFNQSLSEWINSQQTQKTSRGNYLSDSEKGMIRSGLEGIEEISNNDYTCDKLFDSSTYVVVGGMYGRLKILPYNINPKYAAESNISVRTRMRHDFATMLRKHILPLSNNIEFDNLIGLIQNPNASLDDLFEHPVLATPEKRLVMYQAYDHMSLRQQKLFNAIPMGANWQSTARSNHPVLKSILDRQQFNNNATGALHFGNVVASHYAEHLKRVNKMQTTGYMCVNPEIPDCALQTYIPLLLCYRHSMNCDAAFMAG